MSHDFIRDQIGRYANERLLILSFNDGRTVKQHRKNYVWTKKPIQSADQQWVKTKNFLYVENSLSFANNLIRVKEGW